MYVPLVGQGLTATQVCADGENLLQNTILNLHALLLYCLQISMNVRKMLLIAITVALIWMVATSAHVKLDMHFQMIFRAA